MSETYLDTSQVSEMTGVPEPTLRYWRHIGQGPRSFTMGPKLVRYAEGDVRDWIAQQRDKQTA